MSINKNLRHKIDIQLKSETMLKNKIAAEKQIQQIVDKMKSVFAGLAVDEIIEMEEEIENFKSKKESLSKEMTREALIEITTHAQSANEALVDRLVNVKPRNAAEFGTNFLPGFTNGLQEIPITIFISIATAFVRWEGKERETQYEKTLQGPAKDLAKVIFLIYFADGIASLKAKT